MSLPRPEWVLLEILHRNFYSHFPGEFLNNISLCFVYYIFDLSILKLNFFTFISFRQKAQPNLQRHSWKCDCSLFVILHGERNRRTLRKPPTLEGWPFILPHTNDGNLTSQTGDKVSYPWSIQAPFEFHNMVQLLVHLFF